MKMLYTIICPVSKGKTMTQKIETGRTVFTTAIIKQILTILCTLSLLCVSSCAFFDDGIKKDDGNSGGGEAKFESIRLNKTALTIKAGEMTYLSYTVRPGNISIDPDWTYDENIILLEKKQNGVIITGKKEGYTSVTVTYQGKSDTCIITVSGFTASYQDTTEPYIYSSQGYLILQNGDRQMTNVSLYNGNAEDINGYTWTIEDSNVAQISPTGQYCEIHAKKQGYTRIKVVHTKAKQAYYIGLYVFEDVTKTPFITTKENITTMQENGDEQTITVSLVNSKTENYAREFTWQLVSGTDVVAISTNAQKCVITPKAEGEATIRVSHPDAPYPLDITARVIRIVKNVYVEPDDTRVVLNGETPHELKVKLHGLTEGSDYSPDEFTWEFDKADIVDWYTYGNTIVLTGKKNGSANLYVGHPKAKQKRQVLVIVENSTSGAIDTTCLITTTQNYIKTKEGEGETAVTIFLRGGTDGDERDFSWNILQQPLAAGNDVISLTTTDGKVTSARSARAANMSYSLGTAHITPLHEGTAVITLRHPKAYYPTEILVKVLNKGALLTSPLYFSGTGIVKFLNSETYNYTASLLGSNKTASDDSAIKWESDKPTLHINASGAEAVLSSTATGNTVSHITLTHPKAESPKKILILTADTQEKLDAMKAFYADKTYYAINVNKTVNLFVNHVGFDTVDAQGNITPFDFSAASWTSSNPLVATVEKNADNPLGSRITGVKAGTATIRVAYSNIASLDFTVTVYPANVSIETVEKTKYFTTTNNVVNLEGEGKSAEVSVTPIGIPASDFGAITWQSNNPLVATVFPNGERATINAVQKGEAEITVSHKDSENKLKLYVRVGSKYVITPTKPAVYIATSVDPVLLVKDDPVFTLTAALANVEGNEGASGFTFTMSDPSIASISAQYGNGKCFIKPLKAGETELTIHHAAAVSDRKLLVLVANTQEELAAFRHLTTNQNMVTIAEGDTAQVTVSVKNSSEAILSGYSWTSDNPETASIVSNTGAMAVLKGNSIGVTTVYVKNDQCKYPLKIIVQVVDQVSASAHPHIHVNNPLVMLTVSKSWTELSADLVGGKAGDERMFSWTGANNSIIQCYGQNGKGMVRGLKSGTTYITVSHPKAKYPQPLTVVVDEPELKPCSISVSCGNTLSLKPNAGDQTITAQLIGGEETDKYNFKWSLDVYDIVNLDYNANTGILTPLKEGTCTLTIHHPKSAHDQQVRIKVQKYDNFGFGRNNVTVKEGKSAFLQMQIPASSVPTHVQYTTDSPAVVKVGGTDSVCQITGLKGNQSAIVHAKLIAANTGIVQSSADLLVAVEESAANEVYITGGTTVYTITKGKSTTIEAILVGPGVTELDQMNLTWETSNPDIVRIRGVDVAGKYAGKQCYVTAIEGGDCTITIRHDKSPSPLTYHIIVPEEDAAEVSLNKSYIKLTQGRTTELQATIKNGKSADYKTLVWEAATVNNEEIVRIMGNGHSVSLFGIKPGRTKIRCTLPATGVYAECDIVIDAQSKLSFETNAVRVQPGKTRTIQYMISPQTASITWTKQTATGIEYITAVDNGNTNGNGMVTITGIKEGVTSLIATSSSGNSATLQVICAWDYEFSIIGSTTFTCTPEETKTVEFKVSPIDSKISVVSTDEKYFTYEIKNNGNGTGAITFTPTSETPSNIFISLIAQNPGNNDEEVGKKILTAAFKYDKLTPLITMVSKQGKFSKWDKDSHVLMLGDGEVVQLKFDIAETKAAGKIKNVVWKPSTPETANITALLQETVDSGQIYAINHPDDVVANQYKIITGYKPVYAGQTIEPSDFSWRDARFGVTNGKDETYELYEPRHCPFSCIKDIDSIHDLVFMCSWTGGGVTSRGIYACFLDNGHSQYSDGIRYTGAYERIRDPASDGKIFSMEDFEKIGWYFCPGKAIHHEAPRRIMHENIDATLIDSTDTTIQSSSMAGFLLITISHIGSDQSNNIKIPVYLEVRNCSKDYTAEP